MATNKGKRFFGYLVLAVILFCVVLYFYRPLRSSIPFYKKLRTAAIIVFRNPLCSSSEALKGLSIQPCLEENRKPLTEGSRLLSTDPEGFELYETPKGNFWVPPKGGIYNLAYLLAEQACKVYGSGKVGVQPGDIVLDCGANIGTYTREALDAGAKLVVAIEPSPNNIKCLHLNFKTEVKQGRVIVYEKGVWNREEILTFHASDSSVLDSFVLPLQGSRTIMVPVTTIDKLVNELKLDRVDFIKMDIEGSEENALLGAKETIANHKPRIALSLEHVADHEKDTSRMLNIVKSANPGYQTQCGDCGITREGVLYPHVLFFH